MVTDEEDQEDDRFLRVRVKVLCHRYSDWPNGEDHIEHMWGETAAETTSEHPVLPGFVFGLHVLLISCIFVLGILVGFWLYQQ